MGCRHMWVVIAACAVGACRPADSASGDSAALPSDAGRAPGATTAAAVRCGVDAGTMLTGDGIGDLRVGATVESVTRSCRVVRDTMVLGAEAMRERRLLVDLGRDTVATVIDSNRVWRLHVTSPAFRTADSLGVGTAASALRQREGAKLLVGEGKIFVTVSDHCGLSFRLRGVEFGRVTTPDQIPADASVDEVLAVGCQRGAGG